MTICLDGQVVAKYCDRCKRYTKGDSAHFTTEHKGSSKDEAKPNEISPMASLAAIEDCPVLLRCEVPNYDTPILSTGDLNLAAAQDDDSIDSTYNAFFAAAPGPTSTTTSLTDDFALSDAVYPGWSDWWAHLKEYRGQGH